MRKHRLGFWLSRQAKRKDGLGHSGSSNQDRLGRDAKGMLGRCRLFYGAVLPALKALTQSSCRVSWILPPL